MMTLKFTAASKTFCLFNRMITIDEARFVEIATRRVVMSCAEQAQKSFEDYYHKKLYSLDSLMEKGADKVVEILSAQASNCIKFTTSLGVYTLSDKDLLRQATGGYFAYEFEELEKWYISVLKNEAEKDAYRKARRQNRSRWVGGGLSLNSMAYASAQAGMLNLASGAAHGTINLIGKGFSSIGASASKNSVFKNPETCKRLSMALYMDIFEWIYSIQAAIRRTGISIDVISKEDEQVAATLFENLKHLSSNQAQAYEVAGQLFETNPCEFEYYEYCIKHYQDQQKTLFELAEHCAIDVSGLIEPIMKGIFDSMPHKTEKETILLNEKLEEKKQELGIQTSPTIEKVKKMLHNFDVAARTFRNVTYDTREKRAVAETDYRELSQLCGDIKSITAEKCGILKADISKKDYVSEVSKEFLNAIECRVCQLEYTTHSKQYESLYERDAQNNPELIATKKWWKAPLIFTVTSLVLPFVIVDRLPDPLYSAVTSFIAPYLLPFVSIVFWVYASIHKDSVIKKYSSKETQKEKELLDAAHDKYLQAKKVCEEDEKIHGAK